MRIAHAFVGVVTERVQECRAFYTTHLGFDVLYALDWYVHLRSAGGVLDVALLHPYHPTQHAGLQRPFQNQGVWLSLEVNDVDAELSRLQQAGVPVVMPLRDEIWGERHFLIQDPAGTFINIAQRIPHVEGFHDQLAWIPPNPPLSQAIQTAPSISSSSVAQATREAAAGNPQPVSTAGLAGVAAATVLAPLTLRTGLPDEAPSIPVVESQPGEIPTFGDFPITEAADLAKTAGASELPVAGIQEALGGAFDGASGAEQESVASYGTEPEEFSGPTLTESDLSSGTPATVREDAQHDLPSDVRPAMESRLALDTLPNLDAVVASEATNGQEELWELKDIHHHELPQLMVDSVLSSAELEPSAASTAATAEAPVTDFTTPEPDAEAFVTEPLATAGAIPEPTTLTEPLAFLRQKESAALELPPLPLTFHPAADSVEDEVEQTDELLDQEQVERSTYELPEDVTRQALSADAPDDWSPGTAEVDPTPLDPVEQRLASLHLELPVDAVEPEVNPLVFDEPVDVEFRAVDPVGPDSSDRIQMDLNELVGLSPEPAPLQPEEWVPPAPSGPESVVPDFEPPAMLQFPDADAADDEAEFAEEDLSAPQAEFPQATAATVDDGEITLVLEDLGDDDEDLPELRREDGPSITSLEPVEPAPQETLMWGEPQAPAAAEDLESADDHSRPAAETAVEFEDDPRREIFTLPGASGRWNIASELPSEPSTDLETDTDSDLEQPGHLAESRIEPPVLAEEEVDSPISIRLPQRNYPQADADTLELSPETGIADGYEVIQLDEDVDAAEGMLRVHEHDSGESSDQSSETPAVYSDADAEAEVSVESEDQWSASPWPNTPPWSEQPESDFQEQPDESRVSHAAEPEPEPTVDRPAEIEEPELAVENFSLRWHAVEGEQPADEGAERPRSPFDLLVPQQAEFPPLDAHSHASETDSKEAPVNETPADETLEEPSESPEPPSRWFLRPTAMDEPEDWRL